MREKIVILGNGFDLRHFLPTKYNHLITILRVIENLKFGNEIENDFEELFGTFFKQKDNWFYENINEYYETKNIYFQTDELKSIQQRIRTNSWFQYLKSVEDDKIETWIDFETEIERVLITITSYFENYSNNIYETKITKREYRKNNLFMIDYRYCENYFTNRFQFKVLTYFNLFYKIDDSVYELNNQFYLEIDNVIQNYKERFFFDLVYKSLEDFIGIFNDYIEKIVNVFYSNFKKEKKEGFIYLENKFLFDKSVQIYSFNYTNTYQNLYEFENGSKIQLTRLVKSDNSEKIDFVHGKSIENWSGNIEKLEIVLGVNDINPLLKNHKLFQFTKYFQKLHKSTDYLFLDQIISSVKSGIMNYYIDFIFWGHSLDVSDKNYIDDVFYMVKNTQSRIKIFYHSISGKADQLKNLLGIQDKNTIESMMKNEKLIFIESTQENLFEEL